MPGEDRVRGNETGEVEQRLSADRLPCDRQPPALLVGEPDPSLPELLEQDAVLFPEIVDRRLLVAVDPSGDGGEEDMPGLDDLCHGWIPGWIADPMRDSNSPRFPVEFGRATIVPIRGPYAIGPSISPSNSARQTPCSSTSRTSRENSTGSSPISPQRWANPCARPHERAECRLYCTGPPCSS